MLRRTLISACAGAVLCLAAGTAGASNFTSDVNTAINRGLEFLNTDGAFSGYNTTTQRCISEGASGSGSYMRGMALLALLEKRFTGDLNTSPQGYWAPAPRTRPGCARPWPVFSTASTRAARRLITTATGSWASRSMCGPADPARASRTSRTWRSVGLTAAIDLLTDRTLAAQGSPTDTVCYRGMWSYSGRGPDSSTTQFAAAGLGGAKAYYVAWEPVIRGDVPQRSPRRSRTPGLRTLGMVLRLDRTTARATGSRTPRRATATSRVTPLHFSRRPPDSGCSCSAAGRSTTTMCRPICDGSVTTIAGTISTASGADGRLLILDLHVERHEGPPDDPGVGQSPNAGNLGSASWGLLGPTTDPNTGDALPGICPVRQLHKEPATVARNAAFGADPGGYYAGEAQNVYFDFASAILSHQCANGDFSCNRAPGPGTALGIASPGPCWSCSAPRAVPAPTLTPTASAIRMRISAEAATRTLPATCFATQTSTARSRGSTCRACTRSCAARIRWGSP